MPREFGDFDYSTPSGAVATSLLWVVVGVLFLCAITSLCGLASYPTVVYAYEKPPAQPRRYRRGESPLAEDYGAERALPQRGDFVVTLDRMSLD